MSSFASRLDAWLSKLPAIKPGRHAAMAFLLALILGAVGIGVYMRSWFDALLWAVLLIGWAVLLPDVTPVLSWAACACWAALRVNHANRMNSPPSSGHPASVPESSALLLDAGQRGAVPAL